MEKEEENVIHVHRRNYDLESVTKAVPNKSVNFADARALSDVEILKELDTPNRMEALAVNVKVRYLNPPSSKFNSEKRKL